MLLRNLEFFVDEHRQFRELGFPFAWSAHHVKEIFLALLPRGYSLDGSSHITIRLDPPGDGQDVYEQVLGTSEYCVTQFDVASYKAADACQRQELVLELIVDALRAIAALHEADARILTDTAKEVRRANFCMEIPAKKLHRWNSDRTRQLRVIRKLSLDVGEAWSVNVVDKSGKLTDLLWITQHPDYLNRVEQFHKSAWDGGQLVIIDRLGREEVRIDLKSKTVLRWGEVHSQRRARRYDAIRIDVQPLLQRAITAAGHAHKAGDYSRVVELLIPYADFLPSKQLARLQEATMKAKE